MTMKRFGERGRIARALPWLAIAAGFAAVGYFAATGKPKNTPAGTDRFVAAASTALGTTTASTAPPAPPAPKPAPHVITIRASRGDCWIDARAGSAAGPILYRALLHRGRSLRLRPAVVWVTFGFSANVDVRVDGRPRPIPSGTTSIVLRRAA